MEVLTNEPLYCIVSSDSWEPEQQIDSISEVVFKLYSKATWEPHKLMSLSSSFVSLPSFIKREKVISIALGEKDCGQNDMVGHEGHPESLKLNAEKTFKCKYCPKAYIWKHHLNRHVKTRHQNSTNNRNFKCNRCPKSFNRKDNLMRHKRNKREIEFTSVIEKVGGQNNEDYQAYEKSSRLYDDGTTRTDTKDKFVSTTSQMLPYTTGPDKSRPWKCRICEKSYTTKFQVKRHSWMNGIDAPFDCDDCGARFPSTKYLEKHKISHTHSHRCDMCSKEYNWKGDLKRHMDDVHMNIRPYHCGTCGKTFSRSHDFVRHSAIHSPHASRVYKCENCWKDFFRKDRLKEHMYIHTGKPYQCASCGIGFIYKSHLKKHMDIIHSSK